MSYYSGKGGRRAACAVCCGMIEGLSFLGRSYVIMKSTPKSSEAGPGCSKASRTFALAFHWHCFPNTLVFLWHCCGIVLALLQHCSCIYTVLNAKITFNQACYSADSSTPEMDPAFLIPFHAPYMQLKFSVGNVS